MKIPNPTVEQVAQSLKNHTENEEIGRGGFKTVFRAKCANSIEAIKLIGLPKRNLYRNEKYKE